jgi:hypothetical protein
MKFETKFESNSFTNQVKVIDLFKEKLTGSFSLSSDITGTSGERLDAHFWLPLCANELNISPSLKDYLIVNLVGFISGIPNTNGDCISKKELLRWDSECGCPVYKTFKGKPTHLEHNNQNLVEAKGVIFDSYISPLTGFKGDHAKVVLLAGFDRSKDPQLANDILTGKSDRYSIGAKFDQYSCSYTGRMYSDAHGSSYTRPGIATYATVQGDLVYRLLFGVRGFELSSVATPAFCMAVSDLIIT